MPGKIDVLFQTVTWQLMSWLANELIERIDNELQRVILVGDGRTAGATNKITSFETIGTKTQADAYTVYAEKQTLCLHWLMFVLW